MDLSGWISLLTETLTSSLSDVQSNDPCVAACRQILGDRFDGPESVQEVTFRRRELRLLLDYARHLPLIMRNRSERPSDGETLVRPRPWPAGRGADLVEQLWTALARCAASGGEPQAEARGALACHDGRSFLQRSPEDQPEAFWYDELVLLHGATSYAMLTGDPLAWDVATSGAEHHRAEIQPDHATANPWALHAFIFNPSTRDLAEFVLNACLVQYGGRPVGPALVLLADAVYCLRHAAAHGQPARQPL
jgi:hypothetical protein